jgi:MFS family permease
VNASQTHRTAPGVIGSSAPSTSPVKEPASPGAWWTLSILLLFYLLSFTDKQMMSLLVNAMGKALALQDVQLGTLVGAAFGVFYTISVIGAGWLIDRFSKKLILFLAVLGWSLAAAGTGVASTYGQLFLARALVGIGEGFLPSASFALIALVFPRSRVATATGIFFAGANAGSVVALLFGGKAIAALTASGGFTFPVLGHVEAWRSAFLVTALPGVPIAFLACFLYTRGNSSGAGTDVLHSEREGYWRFMRLRRALILRHNFAFGMNSAACYAILMWAPTYVERVFHWKADRVGLTLAIGSVCGGLANVTWGAVADRLKRRGCQDGLYRLFTILFLLCIPSAIVTFGVLGPNTFLIGYVVTSILLLGSGGLTTAMQLATPPNLRGRITSLQTLASGVFGLALAPMIVPSLTQYVFHDKLAVGYAIAAVITVALSIAILLLQLARQPLCEAIDSQEMEPSDTSA